MSFASIKPKSPLIEIEVFVNFSPFMIHLRLNEYSSFTTGSAFHHICGLRYQLLILFCLFHRDLLFCY